MVNKITVEQRTAPGSTLRKAFLKWQCRVRQIAMRENQGRPDASIAPLVWFEDSDEPFGQIITVMSKMPIFSKTPELKHLCQSTHDPAQRREKALQLFSETYYQKADEFSDMLTACFQPNSPGAGQLVAKKKCRLVFEAYNQKFELICAIRQLGEFEPQYQATWWHNKLFNPDLHPETTILGFSPQWEKSETASQAL